MSSAPNDASLHFQFIFLTDDERMRQMCRAYWDGYYDEGLNVRWRRRVSDIAAEFDLPPHEVSNLVSKLCMASGDAICRQCRKPISFQNRTAFHEGRRESTLTCGACLREACRARDEELQARADADRAHALAQAALQEMRIRERFSIQYTAGISRNSLDFDDAVYLLALLRCATTEQMEMIGPISRLQIRLAPTRAFELEIIQQLFSKRRTLIHPESDVSAFNFDGKGEPYTANLLDVIWYLPREQNQPLNYLAIDLEQAFRQKDWPTHWYDQWRDLARRVALDECLEYLQLVVAEHGLTYQIGEKTRHVLSNVLESYSTAEVYNMIWRAGRDAAAYYMRAAVAKQRAANTVIGNIERFADKATAEGWTVKPYSRDRRCPQSSVSRVLFDVAIGAGENGFTISPSLLQLSFEPGLQLESGNDDYLDSFYESEVGDFLKFLTRDKIDEIIRLVDAARTPERKNLADVVSSDANQKAYEAIEALSLAEKAELMAIMWLGRGEGDRESFPDLVIQAEKNMDGASEYMLGKVPFTRYLRDGLAALDLW